MGEYVWRSNGAMTRLHALRREQAAVFQDEPPHLSYWSPTVCEPNNRIGVEVMALNDYSGLPKCKRCLRVTGESDA